VLDDRPPGMFRVQLGVPVELIGDLWIGVSGDLLITS